MSPAFCAASPGQKVSTAATPCDDLLDLSSLEPESYAVLENGPKTTAKTRLNAAFQIMLRSSEKSLDIILQGASVRSVSCFLLFIQTRKHNWDNLHVKQEGSSQNF